jgi:hypothetical protein
LEKRRHDQEPKRSPAIAAVNALFSRNALDRLPRKADDDCVQERR